MIRGIECVTRENWETLLELGPAFCLVASGFLTSFTMSFDHFENIEICRNSKAAKEGAFPKPKVGFWGQIVTLKVHQPKESEHLRKKTYLLDYLNEFLKGNV